MTDEGFWAYLQQQLRRRRMSQADLARLIHVRPSTVSRWQTQAPSTEILRRLAPVLGVPVVELFVKAGHLEPEEAHWADRPSDRTMPHNDGPGLYVESDQDPVEAAIEADPQLSTRQQKDAALAVVRSLRGQGGSGGGSHVTDGDDRTAQRL